MTLKVSPRIHSPLTRAVSNFHQGQYMSFRREPEQRMTHTVLVI